jgi:hypothetical protein
MEAQFCHGLAVCTGLALVLDTPDAVRRSQRYAFWKATAIRLLRH